MNSPEKLHVVLLYGGRSCEHEVSVISARCIYQALDTEKYDINLVGITKSGKWLLIDDPELALESNSVESTGQQSVTLDYSGSGQLLIMPGSSVSSGMERSIDVIFPVLHGPYGEDGTIQGLLELADVAFVGSGVTGSSVGMDKIVSKAVCHAAGIPQTKYMSCLRNVWEESPDTTVREIELKLNYPIFVKPASLGSSVGISKAKNTSELRKAIELAAKFDIKIVLEEGLENCHEIEVSVLGNDKPVASEVGEIIPGGEFYDYDDKYINGVAQTIVPADLPEAVVNEIKRYAVCAFREIDAVGLARVDFFVKRGSHEIYINEINTMPGFTPISMYPKLWAASGIGYTQLLDRLIDLALERHQQRICRQLVL